jgi:hypothetical protein
VSPSQYPRESPKPTLNAAYHRTRNGYQITTDPSALDLETIHAFLQTSYWARAIPRAVVERSLRNSLCQTPAHPERLMEIVRTNVYSEGRAR